MYSVESIQYRYRISVMASDRTQLVQVTVFGSCLDRFFGTSATSFMRFGCKLCNAFYLQVLGVSYANHEFLVLTDWYLNDLQTPIIMGSPLDNWCNPVEIDLVTVLLEYSTKKDQN